LGQRPWKWRGVLVDQPAKDSLEWSATALAELDSVEVAVQVLAADLMAHTDDGSNMACALSIAGVQTEDGSRSRGDAAFSAF
jgi:hypothetical protein